MSLSQKSQSQMILAKIKSSHMIFTKEKSKPKPDAF